MERFDEILSDMEKFGVHVRQNQVYSFGTREECRKMFEEAFCAVDKTVTDFIFLPEYEKIVDWMVDTQGKGLLLSGKCGQGKSIIIKGVIPLIFRYRHRKIIYAYDSSDMNTKQKEMLSKPFLCIDEVGSEATQVSYGERKEVFCEIVSDAENRIKPLFLSTNLTGEQIEQRYGARVRSRINRLCKCIVFNSQNKDLRATS